MYFLTKIVLLTPMKARVKEESWILADLSRRFYGYIFCKPLGDNTPPVEIVYRFNGLVNLKLPVIPTTVSIGFHSAFFVFVLLEDEQKIGMGAFDSCIFLHIFITYLLLELVF